MRIRPEQIRNFEQGTSAECEAFVREFLVENAPEIVAGMPRETFERRVRVGIDRADTYEIEQFADLAAFVYFMFKVGPDFDEYPPFQALLTDEDLSPDDRMATLVEVATDQDWAAAQEGCEPGGWGPLGA